MRIPQVEPTEPSAVVHPEAGAEVCLQAGGNILASPTVGFGSSSCIGRTSRRALNEIIENFTLHALNLQAIA